MWICIGIAVWVLLGICGYVMYRQGALVQYEEILGKKSAWGSEDAVLALIGVLYGPLFCILVFGIEGKDCFKKRPAKERKESAESK